MSCVRFYARERFCIDAVYSMMADHEIQMADGDRVGEFYVKFHGPKSSEFVVPLTHGGTEVQGAKASLNDGC